ncbi:uncharacterized protein AB675_7177 [Cyphellophora attinorum]|uniref:Uncharacterized protein n=1 Tax=Cyphellophora attinorum TaxID=1664694 RepID=A0A0N1P265_9EURO|nr:uncharacterized protein AB675_7177 [Phialophora attinorum]KPI43240.1 hypothetical protein AB675_7177 [Phialophora attinorum]
MTSFFDWSGHGLDQARFEGLAKLLRLRYHGQVEHPSRYDELQRDAIFDDDDANSDAATNRTSTLVNFNPGRLRRTFLDRLAEVIANEKGGRHVAATMMVQAQDSVNVFVAKNNKFRQADISFLDQLAALLRLVAGSRAFEAEIDQHTSLLWNRLLEHYEMRVQGYVVELRQLLKLLFPGESPSDQYQASDTQILIHLRVLRVAIYTHYPSTLARNQALVEGAYSIYRSFVEEDFAALPSTSWQRLRSCLGFLGRLQASFKTFIKAAERLPGFENVKVLVVQPPAQGNSKSGGGKVVVAKWTVPRLFEHIGYEFTDKNVSSLLTGPGKKSQWTRNKLLQEFNKLGSWTGEVHAELQLLPSYLQAQETNNLAAQYIGCSKHSCFLCWHFLEQVGAIRTRGCHGKLYNLWGLPDFHAITASQTHGLLAAVRHVESLVEKQILATDAQGRQQAKESTLGPSSIGTALPGSGSTPLTRLIIQEHLVNQRANSSRAQDTGKATEVEHAPAMPAADGLNDVEAPRSRLGVVRIVAERGSAALDYLKSDCHNDILPTDPGAREDFGFERCRNKAEESNLLGLYIGVLISFEISAEKLHDWRQEGSLLGNIVQLFSTQPEGHRGAYFPWLLRNSHILDGHGKVARDLDDPVKHLDQLYNEARAFLDAADQTKEIWALTPFAKQHCCFFLTLILGHMRPRPDDVQTDLWYDFGFVVCSDEHDEQALWNYYVWLLLGNKFTIDSDRSLGSEDPWEAGSLMELFDHHSTSLGGESYGASLDRRYPALRAFLTAPGGSARPSTWRLKQFLAIDNANVLTVAPEIASAATEYGFHPKLSTRTMLELRHFYIRLFQRGLLPESLDEARRKGILQSMADERYGGEISEAIKRVLRGISVG